MDYKISVVIRTYNEEKHIGEVLKSLNKQTYSNFEVIILDSQSTDNTIKIAQNYDVRIEQIEKKEFNYSFASNKCVEYATGEIVCFLSGHSVPKRNNYLELANKVFQDERIGGCYGEVIALPDCNLARSGYNEAKRTCEALTQSYRSVFGVNAVIARFARVFGADKKHDTKAMSQFMDKAVLGEDIILKSKGQQRYSYCYIADAVSGLLKLLLDGQDGEAYNISNDDDGLTLGEYAEYIASLANLKVRYEIENNESVSKATFALLDTHKIKNIGWKPQYSVKDGLKRTYMIKKEQLTNVD